MARWPHVTVVLDPELAALLRQLPAAARPPLSALLRAEARVWLAARGVPCPPAREALSPAERSALGVEARAKKKEGPGERA